MSHYAHGCVSSPVPCYCYSCSSRNPASKSSHWIIEDVTNHWKVSSEDYDFALFQQSNRLPEILAPHHTETCGPYGGDDGWEFSLYPDNPKEYVVRLETFYGNWMAHWVMYGIKVTWSDGETKWAGNTGGGQWFSCDLSDRKISSMKVYESSKEATGLDLKKDNGQGCWQGSVPSYNEHSCSSSLGSGRIAGVEGRASSKVIKKLGVTFYK